MQTLRKKSKGTRRSKRVSMGGLLGYSSYSTDNAYPEDKLTTEDFITFRGNFNRAVKDWFLKSTQNSKASSAKAKFRDNSHESGGRVNKPSRVLGTELLQ